MPVISITANDDDLSDIYNIFKNSRRHVNNEVNEWVSRNMRELSDKYRTQKEYVVVFKDNEQEALIAALLGFLNNNATRGSRYKKASQIHDLAIRLRRREVREVKKSIKNKKAVRENGDVVTTGWDTGEAVWDTGLIHGEEVQESPF